MQRLPTFSLARSELHSRLSPHQEGGVCSSRCRRTGYQTQVAPGTAGNKDYTRRGTRGRPRSRLSSCGRKRGRRLKALGPGVRPPRPPPLPPVRLGLGRSHRKSVQKGSASGAHGEDFMTADGAVASPGDPRQRCEPPPRSLLLWAPPRRKIYQSISNPGERGSCS